MESRVEWEVGVGVGSGKCGELLGVERSGVQVERGAGTRCEKQGVHSSETRYFVYGTSVSSCLLVLWARIFGQAIQHTCSFSSFQLAQRTRGSQSFFLALWGVHFCFVSHLVNMYLHHKFLAAQL